MNWLIRDFQYKNNEELLKSESIFNLANGYIGVRGNFEEGYKQSFDTIRGTYLNGVYETEDIIYGEKLHGFPNTKQKLINVIDSQSIDIYIDDERFSLFEGQVLDYERTLNMEEGYLVRRILWQSPKGHKMSIKITRLISFHTLELFLVHYEVTSLNYQGKIKIISSVNGDITNYTDEFDPRTGTGNDQCYNRFWTGVKSNIVTVSNTTKESGIQITCNSFHSCNVDCDVNFEVQTRQISTILLADVMKGERLEITKYNIYTDSRRFKDPEEQGIKIMEDVIQKSFTEHLEEQNEYMKAFWDKGDVVIRGDDRLLLGIRYNLFQLLQSVGKDKWSNIAAKGLSGEGYEGHYFWDTEIYIFPYFLMTNPDMARNLLLYRYNHLDQARARALELGHKRGALFPWRTINGEECSSFFPAGTAQYHINADIAYALIQYYLITEDEEFMEKWGVEILFETARLWSDIGHFHDGQFKINAVTGPDEYTCIVDNNYYTNVMAKHNIKWAVKMYDRYKGRSSHVNQVIHNLKLTEKEIKRWKEAYTNMYLPYDDTLKINPQDDTFLEKKVWDMASIPGDKFPLLLHYHPLILYRYQICKQADTVLAHFLLEDEESQEVIKNTYRYYEKITTHDSSLSYCIYSIMASKIGEREKAYDYFMKSVRLDLDDHQGNTKHGIHTANMGGTYLAMVFGFAGLRIKENMIALNPVKPKQWKGYRFKLNYKGREIDVDINENGVSIHLDKGRDVDIKIYDKVYTITKEIKVDLI